jgi:hypothetical protein
MLEVSQLQAWVLFLVIVVALFSFIFRLQVLIEPLPKDEQCDASHGD